MKRLFTIVFTTVILGSFYKVALAQNSNNQTEDLNANTPSRNENITLDGMIGPYDPNDPDKVNDPDFDDVDPSDLEGELPVNYYTIAVTVPTNMHFTVVSGFGRGQFYSPKYTIENKATRPIHVSVKGLTEQNVVESNEFTKLYLKTPVHYDDNTEIDLYLSMLNTSTSHKKQVRLSEFDATSATENHYLGVLGLKQSGILQFESKSWDVPGLDAPDKHAKNDFTLQLEFSLQDPTQPTPPEESTDPVEPNPPVEGEGDTNTDTVE